MCCDLVQKLGAFRYRHTNYIYKVFDNVLSLIRNLQQDQEVQENQEVPANQRREKKEKNDWWHCHNHVIKRLLSLFTLSPTGPLGPIGPEEPCRQQRSKTQSHTGTNCGIWQRVRDRPMKWCFLQQLLEDRGGLSVQEDRSRPAPLWRPGKQTRQE